MGDPRLREPEHTAGEGRAQVTAAAPPRERPGQETPGKQDVVWA